MASRNTIVSMSLLFAAVLVLAPVGPVNADLINFTDESIISWSDAEGLAGRLFTGIPELDGLNMAILAFNSIDGLGGATSTTLGRIYHDNTDGFGILAGERDEVNPPEVLGFFFSGPVTINSITFTDLFDERNNLETAWYYTDSMPGNPLLQSTWQGFSALPGNPPISQGNGEYTVNVGLGGQNVTALLFTSFERTEEFSVKALDVTVGGGEVPEPGSILLFGSAAGLLGYLRRRRAAKRN